MLRTHLVYRRRKQLWSWGIVPNERAQHHTGRPRSARPTACKVVAGSRGIPRTQHPGAATVVPPCPCALLPAGDDTGARPQPGAGRREGPAPRGQKTGPGHHAAGGRRGGQEPGETRSPAGAQRSPAAGARARPGSLLVIKSDTRTTLKKVKERAGRV